MGALFALVGAIAGFSIAIRNGVEGQVLSILFALACLAYAIRGRNVIPFLAGFIALLGIGLFYRFYSPSLGRTEVYGVVIKTGANYFVLRGFGSSYYVYSAEHSYQFGDVLAVTGKAQALRITTYESQFDFLSYLQGLGAKAEIASPSIRGIALFPLRIGVYARWYLSSFDSETAALLNALLFGRKDYSSGLISSASALNMLFVLSSSGVLYSMALRAFQSALEVRLSEKQSAVVTLVLGAILLFLNLEKIGLWRAFLMRLLGVIDPEGKRLDYFAKLGLAPLLLIVAFPYNAISSALWIGAGLSFCRYLFSSFLQDEKRRKLLIFVKGYAFVQVFLFPLTLSSGNVHLLALLYGPVLLPFMAVYAFVGVIGLAGVPVQGFLGGFTSFIDAMFSFFEKADFSLALPSLPSWAVFLLYAFLLLGFFLHEAGLVKANIAFSIGIAAVYAVSLIPAGYIGLEAVYFVNVGQGDCTLVYDHGTAVMIDTGGVVGMDIAKESLLPYLRKKRIYHLDALIITHPDYDHYGGRDSLVARFDVRRVIEEADAFPLDIGRLHFENHNVFGGDEANDRSLVLDFNVMGKRVFVMGDAPIEIEKRIVGEGKNLDCDILKVGHHGSNTSTSEEWLDRTTPDIAVISCARKNSYGHPSKDVLERLERRNITIRRTDLEGTVEYSRLAL